MIKIAILSWVAFAITVLLLRIIASTSIDLWIWKATDWIIITLFIVAVATSVITIIKW